MVEVNRKNMHDIRRTHVVDSESMNGTKGTTVEAVERLSTGAIEVWMLHWRGKSVT